MIAIGASSADMDRGLRDARKKLRSFGADAKKSLGGLGKKALGGGLGALGAGFGIQAAGGLTEMVTEIFDVEKALTRLQISGSMTGAELASFRDQALAVSKATGVSRAEIVKGAAAYVMMTGDAKGAAEASQLFAEIAAGSGANMEDVAKSAAALRQNLKIDPKDFRKAFDVLIKQGQLGAVEISDLSQQLAAVAPQFGNFSGSKTVEGMSELGAMLQVVRQGFGSVEEAGTGFRGLMTQIEKNQKKLKKAGINIIDPKTNKMKSLLSLIREMKDNKGLQKTGAMFDLLGEAKAVQAAGLLMERLEEVDRIKRDSLGSDQVAKNNAIWQASASGKMAKAWESVKNSLAEAFTPERIEAFAAALVKVTDLLVKAVELVDEITRSLDDVKDDAMTQKLAKTGKTGFRIGEDGMPQTFVSRQDKMNRAAELSGMTDAALADQGGTSAQRDKAVKQLMDESMMQNSEQQIAGGFNAGIAKQKAEVSARLLTGITGAITEGFKNAAVNMDGTKVKSVLDNNQVNLKTPKRH